MALPGVLISKFGKPDVIYAPDLTGKVHDPAGTFDYLRPLATIEPTAIRLGMPVNCDYRYDRIKDLESELVSPAHAGQVIFIAWEHHNLNQMVKDLLQLKEVATLNKFPIGRAANMIGFIFYEFLPATDQSSLLRIMRT